MNKYEDKISNDILDALEKALPISNSDEKYTKIIKLCAETKSINRLFVLDQRGYDGEYEFVCSADFDGYDDEFEFIVGLDRIFNGRTQLAILEKDILVHKERLDAVFDETRAKILKGKIHNIYQRK